ncbi:MAG: DUF3829 domain-containing protein [Pseudomonadota bacterium]|jgi:hypothetical protein
MKRTWLLKFAAASCVGLAGLPAFAGDQGSPVRFAFWPWESSKTDSAAKSEPRKAAEPVPSQGQELRVASDFLQVVRTVRSTCADAAWTLWASNRYEDWRRGRTSVLAMNYSVRTYDKLPPVPETFDAGLRQRIGDAMTKANDTVRDSGPVFKDLANYINAKDYEADKFKKGDALNEKLVAIGKFCHAIAAELERLHVEAAAAVIQRLSAQALRPDVVGTMLADWQQARTLADELGKREALDLARVESQVAALSELADKRRTEFAADMSKSGSPLADFYDRDLNELVGVRMRKALRDIKGKPAAVKEAAEDRPRGTFQSIREQIELAMPADILRFIGR